MGECEYEFIGKGRPTTCGQDSSSSRFSLNQIKGPQLLQLRIFFNCPIENARENALFKRVQLYICYSRKKKVTLTPPVQYRSDFEWENDVFFGMCTAHSA